MLVKKICHSRKVKNFATLKVDFIYLFYFLHPGLEEEE